MNSNQLTCVINCDYVLRERAIGVFSLDQIKKIKFEFGEERFLICNTQPRYRSGEHWIAIVSLPDGSIEFFDSFGNAAASLSPSFETFMRKQSNACVYNVRQLQDESSIVCGHYCVYYLLHRCRGISMSDIVNKFSDNYLVNDVYVSQFISTRFPYCF